MKPKKTFYRLAIFLLATIAFISGCGQAGNDRGNPARNASAEAWEVFESPVLQSTRMAQVAIIVEDIEKSSELFASMFGMDKPAVIIADGHESRPTRYRGQPSDATAKLAFIALENIQVEFIEPDGTPSIWQEFADNYHQGIQHIAFWVDDIEEAEQRFVAAGMEILQSGGWDGGAYSYIDAIRPMGMIIELLHNYP
jgi:methylmalonyl-CoA/ethylmalonyl-CoA epimerase